ncbi:MAG: cysteine--tRNA ligase, partial [Cyanobacteria bacterium CAN_BIN43]|nr:cysteine--tRNA ligase [Cyanobacteria bacterium CAN_BIN43]
QYRKPLDFTEAAIASAENSWSTLKEGLLFGYLQGQKLGWTDTQDVSFGDPTAMRIPMDSELVQRFQTAMDNDLNTPGGVAVLFELAKDLQREGNILTHAGKTATDPQVLRQQWQMLVCLAQVLGLEARPDVEEQVGDRSEALSDAEIDAKVQARNQAKQAKNFAEADRIRDQLKDNGVMLIDKPGGITDWHRG